MRRVVGGVLALLPVLGLALWLARRAPESMPSRGGAGTALLSHLVPGESVPERAAAVPSPSVSSVPGQDEVEACGGRWIKLAKDGSLDRAALERSAQLPQARARLLDELRADPRELAQAAAVWLGMVHAQAARAADPEPACENPDCVQARYEATGQPGPRCARAPGQHDA